MRVLGLDYGDNRIGVAVSDGLGWTATAMTTIARKNHIDLKESIAQISKIVAENDVKRVVLGYPKNMDGSEGQNCQKVQNFKAKLFAALGGIDIVLHDERLSTSRAVQIYREAGIKTKKIAPGGVDKMAAQVILQGYLDMQAKRTNIYKGERNMNDEKLFDMDEEIELPTIIMNDDDGNEVEFLVIDAIEHDGNIFAVMINAEDMEKDEVDIVIFKQVEANDEELIYEEITDEEYDAIKPILDERLEGFDVEAE